MYENAGLDEIKSRLKDRIEKLVAEKGLKPGSLCHCGTCKDALATAKKMVAEAIDNNCTIWYRDRLPDFNRHWRDSLAGVGAVAHWGAIPTRSSAI